MPRCTSTEKFAGYDDPDVESLDDPTVDGQTLTADVTLIRPCADCGEDFASCDFTLEIDQLECPTCGWNKPDPDGGEDIPIEFELDNHSYDLIDEGGSRYAKRYIGVSLTATIRCGNCTETFEVETSDKAAASYFESLV